MGIMTVNGRTFGSDFSKTADRFCIIDVGSTTTKAFLFRRNQDWTYVRREVPTTVEKPDEDVTIGVLHALKLMERDTGEKLIGDDGPEVRLLATSSAGGGLAIVVVGLVAEVTARSAERVALGAGAVVQDVIALNDDRTAYRKIEALRRLRPDMVLMAGGYDGGSIHGPVYLAELLQQSDLRPKFRDRGRVPVIYAGNAAARPYVEQILGDRFTLQTVPNIRPSDFKENLDPARKAIHDTFMDHVMSRAPGYETLIPWVQSSILPTPAAVGRILGLVSEDLDQKILAIDIGGATTDVFTAERGNVFRTVSANLGMSYSILNVVKQSGAQAVLELVDNGVDEADLYNRVGNKFLRPTRLPDDRIAAIVECAAASMAVREAVREHLSLVRGISLSRSEEELSRSVIRRKSGFKRLFGQSSRFDYDLVIGSGGILSHSPRRASAMMLINALQPEGSVELAVDNGFMLPHLGALSQEDEKLALELFYEFGLIRLGNLAAPNGEAKPHRARIRGTSGPTVKKLDEDVPEHEIRWLSVGEGADVRVTFGGRFGLRKSSFDVTTAGGSLIVDCRGRPPRSHPGFYLPDDYTIGQREDRSESRERLYCGTIRETRALAVPGEVYVSDGNHVSPDEIIAKSTKMFLRPFFLHVGRHLDADGDELPKYLNKRIGDEIASGEIFARRDEGFIKVLEFKSPVTGTIEKILSDGTVVVREHPEAAQKTYVVEAAKEMNIRPRRLREYLQVKMGHEVEKGQLLAGNLMINRRKVARSPIRGKVTGIDFEEGTISLSPLIEELELTAWMGGTVENVSDRGCDIVTSGIVIHGIWGGGGETFGVLTDDANAGNAVMVGDSFTPSDLADFQQKGIRGLIAGGLHLKDIMDTDPSYPVVITEGFGVGRMHEDVRKAMRSHIGKPVSIDAETQLRAGVKRPRVILADWERR